MEVWIMEEFREIPFFEQAKIQAQFLVPLVRGFQDEVGEEQTNRIVGKVMDDYWRKFGQDYGVSHEGNPVEKTVGLLSFFSAGDAHEFEMVKLTSDALEMNVTRCPYAEFYKELGASQLGFLLVCRCDFAVAEGLSPNLELVRTQTIMEGASHCDFRYQLQAKPSQE